MLKRIIIFALLTIAIFGCKSDKNCQNPYTTNSYMTNSFNQENYIWESFLFPTNRTSGVQ